MARYSLIAMGVFTVAMFFVPIERVNALADISNLFYLVAGLAPTWEQQLGHKEIMESNC